MLYLTYALSGEPCHRWRDGYYIPFINLFGHLFSNRCLQPTIKYISPVLHPTPPPLSASLDVVSFHRNQIVLDCIYWYRHSNINLNINIIKWYLNYQKTKFNLFLPRITHHPRASGLSLFVPASRSTSSFRQLYATQSNCLPPSPRHTTN